MKLRIWWIPQVPMKPFYQEVQTVKEGALLLEALARYDLFQLENNIKPDYCNVGGLEMIEDGEWIDWYNGEFNDPAEYLESLSSPPQQSGEECVFPDCGCDGANHCFAGNPNNAATALNIEKGSVSKWIYADKKRDNGTGREELG